MHPCLRLSEIFSIICALIDEEDFYRTLAAVALTCKAFKESALDELYREVSILDMLMVLPEDLRDTRPMSRVMTFRRSMMLSDWRILERYVSRVRSLTFSELESDLKIHEDVISSISFFCGAHLFPNVRRVCFDSCFPWAFLPLVLGPRVVEIELGSLPVNRAHTFILLSRACPSLETLSITAGVDFNTKQILPAVLSDAASLGFRKLKTFKLITSCIIRTPSELLPVLSSLQHLQELAFYTNPDIPPSNTISLIHQAPPPFAFPSLRRLTLDSGSPKEVTCFMRSLSGLNAMTALSVALESGSENVDDVIEMLQTLTKTLPADKMRRIKLTHLLVAPLHPKLLNLTTFRRLYRFKDLTELGFNLLSSPELNDSLIRELAVAFPKLEHLSLYFGAHPDAGNHVTLTGLATLLRSCPNLCYISLLVNATTTINAAFDASAPPVCNRRITRVYFGHSPIDDPAFAAHHLADMFPQLSCLSTYGLGSSANGRKWRAVENMVRRINSTRLRC